MSIAEKLLAEHQTLEGIYLQLDQISSKALHEKLKAGKDSANLSKKLVQLVLDGPLPKEAEFFQRQEIDFEQLNVFLNEFEKKNC